MAMHSIAASSLLIVVNLLDGKIDRNRSFGIIPHIGENPEEKPSNDRIQLIGAYVKNRHALSVCKSCVFTVLLPAGSDEGAEDRQRLLIGAPHDFRMPLQPQEPGVNFALHGLDESVG